MKFIHLSDLHIGKRINDFNLVEDQSYILGKILDIIDDEKPEGILIAGDIYDKSVPCAEAVQLFDQFLYLLSDRDLKTFVISGNHDSPERIAFGSRIMDKSGIFLSPVYEGEIKPVTLQDEYGLTNIFMLPFIKPAHVRRYFPDEQIESYTDAVKTVINHMDIDLDQRNILVTHQFVTGASRCESEDISVGGSDNVDASVFQPFDYIALGHIHSPQNISRETIRYCGSPLKYSFSEANQKKSLTIVELGQKGGITCRSVPLIPKRDMREIKGRYIDITAKSFYTGTNTDDYLHITLTDEEDIPEAIGKLRIIYPNIMKLDYDNARTRSNNEIRGTDSIDRKTPLELFSELFEKQNNQPMTSEQQEFAMDLVTKIWEGES